MSIPDYMDIFLINSCFKKVNRHPFFQKGTMAKKCFGILRRAFNYDMRKKQQRINILG